MLKNILFEEFPIIFIEGFENLNNLSDKQFPKIFPKMLCSSVGWYFDESFKQWGANLAESGTKLIGLQHGGNYGIVTPHFAETHERLISDFYLTWGWSDCHDEKCIPISSPKLIKKKNKTEVDKNKILFLSTSPCRYLIEFPWIPERSLEYLKWQKIFFSHFTPEFFNFTQFRPYMHDYVWEIERNMKKIFPDLIFCDPKVPFYVNLKDCKLFVTDHLSTTFIEALSINKPTVLFWDPATNIVNNNVEPFFNKFRRMNILHDSPESAALWVQSTFNNAEKWWFSTECQKVVKDFCDQYAHIARHPIWEIYKIFKRLNRDII